MNTKRERKHLYRPTLSLCIDEETSDDTLVSYGDYLVAVLCFLAEKYLETLSS